MRRRLLLAIGASLILWPQASFAQQRSAKLARIGYLASGGPVNFPITVDSFKRGMLELGYTEGKDYVLELRTADGMTERHLALAAELARLKVDVIVVTSTPGGIAAHKATTTVPIVLSNSSDPVASGIAKSLARPSGNVTGVSNIVSDMSPKQFELLKTIMPRLSKVAVLINPDQEPNLWALKNVQAAGKKSAVDVLPVEARTAVDIERGFEAMRRERAEAVIVALDPFLVQERRRIAEFALKHRLPSVFAEEEHVEAGGLMSYGSNIRNNFRRAAVYVDKILKGAKPGDLPIEQPTKFEFVINLKTAEALGLSVSQELKFRADRLIE